MLTALPDYLRPVIQVGYITGWRIASELLTRTWKNVDLKDGCLRLEPGEGKTGQGREFPRSRLICARSFKRSASTSVNLSALSVA